MIHDTPKPTKGWSWGPSYILKQTPKFAARLGAAMTGMATFALAYSFFVDGAGFIAKSMVVIGAVGAFLTLFFGKK